MIFLKDKYAYKLRDLELIQVNLLPDKRVSEIKNRYKNLICGRASDNRIKRWKILQFAPLKEVACLTENLSSLIE